MKAPVRIIPLLVLLPLWNLSGQQGKPPEDVKIDPAVVTAVYNDCLKRNADTDSSLADGVCKLEASDPEWLKKFGRRDETGKLVPITDKDRAVFYAYCTYSAATPGYIDSCKKWVTETPTVADWFSDPTRSVRKVYVAKFRQAKKVKEALRDTCIEVVDSPEQSDAVLMRTLHFAEYRPGVDYDTTCTSDSVTARCSDGVTKETTTCGPGGNCVSTEGPVGYKDLRLVDPRNGKELDWMDWNPDALLRVDPKEVAGSLSKAVGCREGKNLTK
jgi:hypothetical protein